MVWIEKSVTRVTDRHHEACRVKGLSGGAMVLGKHPVLGRPTNLDYSMARAYCAYSRCEWGLFGHFFLSSIISLFFLPLSGEAARYRLKYCLKGPLSPKQPTNQSFPVAFLTRAFDSLNLQLCAPVLSLSLSLFSLSLSLSQSSLHDND